MQIIVDLTQNKFDAFNTVNFYDSKTIFFDATTYLPSTVSFKIWGAGLMPGFDWKQYSVDLSNDKVKQLIESNKEYEITIQGFSTITFNNVIAGKISIIPYDKGKLLKNGSGEEVKFKREWSLDNIDDECYKYWLDTDIYFPNGACDLKLYTKGNVEFSFNIDECVNTLKYITNPNRKETFWGYLNNKDLTTGSYKYEDIDPKL
jgi:hypothetical protein